eukprot:4707530-Prymnesium_polylepis.1
MADVASSLRSARADHGGLNFDLDRGSRSDGGLASRGRGDAGGGGGSFGGGCWSSSSHGGWNLLRGPSPSE